MLPEVSGAKFNFHKVLATLGIILFVVISVAAGVWYYVDSQDKSSGIEDETTKVSTSSAKVATSSAATSDWKTYTNSDAGFELKYPPQFTVGLPTLVSGGGTHITFRSGNYKEVAIGECLTPTSGASLTVSAKVYNGKTLSQVLESDRQSSVKDYQGVESSGPSVGDKESVKFSYSGPSKYGGACGIEKGEIYEDIYVDSGASVYAISVRYFSTEITNELLVKDILSTLKFL